jgi:hypothetical protein
MRSTVGDWAAVAMTIVIGGVCGFLAIALIPFALSVHFGAQFPWYAARASGMVAYLLATGSVVFGIATSTRLGGRIFGKGNVADTHRSLSLLMLMAIGAHTLFLALDSYTNSQPASCSSRSLPGTGPSGRGSALSRRTWRWRYTAASTFGR